MRRSWRSRVPHAPGRRPVSRTSPSRARGRTPDGPTRWNLRCAAVVRPRAISRTRSEDRTVRSALGSAVEWLLARQHPNGWWVGELETNVTMTAEHVLLLRFLGESIDTIREGAIRHILRNQRDDGSWALYA